jgi:hypothetical protein
MGHEKVETLLDNYSHNVNDTVFGRTTSDAMNMEYILLTKENPSDSEQSDGHPQLMSLQ